MQAAPCRLHTLALRPPMVAWQLPCAGMQSNGSSRGSSSSHSMLGTTTRPPRRGHTASASRQGQHRNSSSSQGPKHARRRSGQSGDNVQGLPPAAQLQWNELQRQQQPLPEQQVLFQQQQEQPEYVSEPWDVAAPLEVPEPWDVIPAPAEPWQQLQQPGLLPDAAADDDQSGGPVMPGRAQLAAAPAAQPSAEAAEDGDSDDGLWLLDGSSDDDDQEGDALRWQPLLPAGPPTPSLQQQPAVPPPRRAGTASSSSNLQRAELARGPPDLLAGWDAALSAALGVLASYDVRRDVRRRPPPARSSNSSSGGGRSRAAARVTATSLVRGGPAAAAGAEASAVSLTAAAAAAAARARSRQRTRQLVQPSQPVNPVLLQQAEAAALQDSDGSLQQQAAPVAIVLRQQATTAQQQQQQQEAAAAVEPLLPEDPRWQQVQRSHAAYRGYMQQLAELVVSQAQQSHQLVHQVGICEHWLQLSHMLGVFGGPALGPAVPAAMWKRLSAIINRRAFVRMSSNERVHYDLFIESLVQQTIASISQQNNGSSSSSSEGRQARARRTSNADSSSSSCTPGQVSAIAYGVAVLGVSNVQLGDALVRAAGVLLRPAAAAAGAASAAAAASEADVSLQRGAGAADESAQAPPAAAAAAASPPSAQPAGAVAAAGGSGADVGGWLPADVAQLTWGLATMGVVSPGPWLQDLMAVSGSLLPWCQPSQLWGVLWGFAKLGHLPPEAWLASWLSAARQQLDAFTADGLARSLWGLAALGHVPDKLWLRAACGMVAYKIRSFQARELSLVLPALSSLGYKPRPELCRTLMAQVRRHLHGLRPSQLVSVITAIASYPASEGDPAGSTGWHPGRLFLFDFVSHSQPATVMQAWSGQQAAQVLWSLGRCRYVPDRSYLRQLLAHLQTQLPGCPPDGLAMALWGLAALRQQLPSKAWADAWCAAAEASGEGWGPQALAHGVSAMAALQVTPPAALMQALTRTASGCLSSFSCMELGLLISGLADLHWRPSDAWMQAFVVQVSEQLPAFENEDYGLLLFGLASLAQPLHPQLMARFCVEAKRKLYGQSGEGLGLLVWGLAQYDYEMDEAADWWAAVFSEFGDKWSSTTLRGCALTAVGLADMGPRHLPPGEWEVAFVGRYKALTGQQRPGSWPELLLGLRAAAGLEPTEPLPASSWFNNLLLQLGRAFKLAEPTEGLPVLVAGVNNQVAAAAAAAAAAGSDAQLDAGQVFDVAADPDNGILGTELQQQLRPGPGLVDIEPTSATAVLL